MALTLLQLPERHWECPNCTQCARTQGHARTPFHRCKGLRGLNAPLVPEGTVCKVETVERGDWVGTEMVQTDGEGRPVMAITTTRDDGVDCTVLAPCATATTKE